jgi:hypothetical protein
MTAREILADLIALAESAGLVVQPVPRGHAIEGGPPVASAACRVGSEWRIVLVASDTLDERIEVVAAALRAQRSDWLESRHVPPALRRHLEP